MASSHAGPIEYSGSSSNNQFRNVTIEEDNDHDDPAISHARDQAVFSDDPFAGQEEVLSFKRKQKQPAAIGTGSRFLSAFTGNNSPSRQGTPSPRLGTPTGRPYPLHTGLGGRHDGAGSESATKDGTDWYVEGPGRRVGYEDMTAIDWIFEYTKERQRLRVLYSSATGFLGYVRQFMDESQIWILLILTGIAAGTLAAGIDVVSDWLGDLKTGYCSSGIDGGHFYLNKYFCCFGYDESAKCRDWVPWSLALNVTSKGGRWSLEYFFFIFFSICFALTASVLVKEYALYAKHSGIPEIKTVLGGFVIRKFMGTWTLVIKSLGLVCFHLDLRELC